MTKAKITMLMISAFILIMSTVPAISAYESDIGVSETHYGTGAPTDVVATMTDDSVVFNFDIDETSTGGQKALAYGHWDAVVLVVSYDRVNPAFQVHNNDGTDPSFAWGDWLYSEWGPIGTGYHGWHTSDRNTPIDNVDGISASGERSTTANPTGEFSITVSKEILGSEFYFAIYVNVPSGASYYPDTWSVWSGDASGCTELPGYAEIMALEDELQNRGSEIADLQSRIDELQGQIESSTDASTIVRLKREVASLQDELDELTMDRDYWMNQTRSVTITSGGGAETEHVVSVVVSAIAVIVIMISLKVIFGRG